MPPTAGGPHLRADGVHVPGPDENVGAAGQLGRQAPYTLPADEDHADRATTHGGVQRQLQPGGGRLGGWTKVGGACAAATTQAGYPELKPGRLPDQAGRAAVCAQIGLSAAAGKGAFGGRSMLLKIHHQMEQSGCECSNPAWPFGCCITCSMMWYPQAVAQLLLEVLCM